MRVKRYVVDSMPDALQRIRTDLGKDAVILNTKEVRSGGFLGFFGKKKIEVIAAMDTATSSAVNTLQTNHAQMPFKSTANTQNVQKTASPILSPVTYPSAVATLEEQPAPEVTQRTEPVREDVLMEELKQMKEMMLKLSFKNNQDSALPEPLQTIKQRLLDQDLHPMLVEQVMHNAVETSEIPEKEWTEENAKQAIREQLRTILVDEQKKSISSDTRIAHFVGPTGVGKTTTIAKLAAEQVLKHNRKVGFITSDTYRIAAVEQLKTYATILNVPLEVVFSPQELAKAFQQLEDRDIIFMDTAGRNFRNQMYVSELNSLLQSKGKSETFLVLSMTSKYSDMKEITHNFAKFSLDKVLFTKMDETRTYGAVVNLLHEFPIKLSYLTNGQNVPDDIVEVNEEKLIDLILEADTHE